MIKTRFSFIKNIFLRLHDWLSNLIFERAREFLKSCEGDLNKIKSFNVCTKFGVRDYIADG